MILIRPGYTLEMDGMVARVTFSPDVSPSVRDYLLQTYGRNGDDQAREPVTLVLNGDDLSDLVIALNAARKQADAALWTKDAS